MGDQPEKTSVIEYPYRLSILICHLNERAVKLAELMAVLEPQLTPDVQLLVESDSGEMDIGAKRNKLLFNARGTYVAYIDDDDQVTPDYIASIMKAIETGPDCVGIEGILRFGNDPDRKFIHSVSVNEWREGEDGIFYRSPNHLNPVRKDIAMQVKFVESMNHGEDHDYSRRIQPLLSSEVYIGHPIYIYRKS